MPSKLTTVLIWSKKTWAHASMPRVAWTSQTSLDVQRAQSTQGEAALSARKVPYALTTCSVSSRPSTGDRRVASAALAPCTPGWPQTTTVSSRTLVARWQSAPSCSAPKPPTRTMSSTWAKRTRTTHSAALASEATTLARPSSRAARMRRIMGGVRWRARMTSCCSSRRTT